MIFNKKNQPPVNYSVVFILNKSNKVLIEKRKTDKTRDPGKITLPSGDIRKNEKKEEALTRELFEEFGINPETVLYLGEILYPKKNENVYRSYFLITKWEGEIMKKEAESLKWITLDPENVDIWPDKIILEQLKYLFNQNHFNII